MLLADNGGHGRCVGHGAVHLWRHWTEYDGLSYEFRSRAGPLHGLLKYERLEFIDWTDLGCLDRQLNSNSHFQVFM